LLLSIILVSCFQKSELEVTREIKNIEFQRSADSLIFEKYADDENVNIRIMTADVIAKIGNPIHLSTLQKFLKDKDPRVIKKSFFAIGQLPDQDSLLLSYLSDDTFNDYDKDIIRALGRSESNTVLTFFLENIDSFPDSLKPEIIEAMTFLAPKKFKSHKIRKYLSHENTDISGAAAYYYSRHPLRSAIASLIEANIAPATLWDKYRLKALQESLNNYKIHYLDSTLHDSLKDRLLSDLKNKSLSWQHLLYELSIMKHYQDSLSFNIIGGFLTHTNPHLRLAAIKAIAQFDTISANSILLHVYHDADWTDKGHILLALAKENPERIYSIIQQNLDKGHTYFKQLLLKSLARINNRMSIRQLRQFLLVPNIRLNLTAFNELSKKGYIGYNQAKKFLLSGDAALTTVAANWIVNHPQYARFEDIHTAYTNFSEERDVETLYSLLQALKFVASEESYRFFQEVYSKTTSSLIAKETRESLTAANYNIPERVDLKPGLFVPDDLIIEKEPIDVLIQTSKDSIIIELYPDVAPATVSNFLHLIQNGFYTNIIFHRVISDFVAQAGDPRGDGWGGPGYVIPSEDNDLSFERGTIGMATSGKDTGGSQFFICHSEQPHLNGRYTIFGKVREGMEVVDLIDIEDKIIQIIIQN
jgi:cyclophilin family peptidyl-prolyl cis-trans isomerase